MKGLVTAVAWMVVGALGVAAQTPSGRLEGTVRDSSGGAIAGAAVELREGATNQGRTLRTDDQGSFRGSDLPVGTYQVRVEVQGFAPYQHAGISLGIGQTVHLDVVLNPEGVVEEVAVTSQPPALDVRQTAVTTSIGANRIAELPVRSRNYLEFVLLAPGVVPSATGADRGGSVLTDSGFSFGGLRPRSNMLSIDGLDNNDAFSGGSRTELSLEIVREFQVVSNGWLAENGGASGGAINVVTRSGTNVLHGDAFLFGQSGHLNARPKLEEVFGARPALTRYRGGLALGGPLVKDRTFYYAAVEQEHARGEAASDVGLGTSSPINAFLDGGSLPRLGTQALTVGLFPTSFSETELSAKLTHQLKARQSLMFRVTGTNARESADAFNGGGLVDSSARGTGGTRDIAAAGMWTTILGDRTTNELRGQFATRRVDLQTSDAFGPNILIPGVVEFGRAYAGNGRHNQTYVEMGDTLAVAAHQHLLKTGSGITHVSVRGTDTDGFGGAYLFPSLDAFLNRQPDSFRQAFGDPTLDATVTRFGLFAQDHWAPRPTLTMDLGIRFDGEVLPAALGVTNRQFSPRLGMAWTPSANWVVRGGAGVFADRIVLASIARALILDGHHGFEQIVDCQMAASILGAREGAALSTPLSSVLPSTYTMRPGSWDPSSRQASIGVERSLTANMTASVNITWVRGNDLPRTLNTNLANIGPQRLDHTRTDIFQLQPTASSMYRGLTATLNRRLSHEVEWSAAYTWSHATDTASDFDEQPQNPHALGDEIADSRYDQRHRFVASALFDLPVGDEDDRKPGEAPAWWVRALSNIELASILSLGSGRAQNPVIGIDVSGGHAFPLADRPLGYGRNGLRLPASATLDLRVLKSFNTKPHGKLDFVVEAFNVLNRTNVTQLDSVYGRFAVPVSGFGRPVEAAGARHVQFSIDFEF